MAQIMQNIFKTTLIRNKVQDGFELKVFSLLYSNFPQQRFDLQFKFNLMNKLRKAKLTETRSNNQENQTKMKSLADHKKQSQQSKGTKKNLRENTKKSQQLSRTQTVRKLHPVSEFSFGSVLRQHLTLIFEKSIGVDPLAKSVIDIIQFMLEKESKYRNLTVQDRMKFNLQVRNRREDFAVYVYSIMEVCSEFGNFNTIFPACYFFFRQFVEKKLTDIEAQYALVTSVFCSSKYHQIYPPFLQEIISYVNFTLRETKVFQKQLQLLTLLDFQQFYSDHEVKWLQILSIILNLNRSDKRMCYFILQSGLNRIQLYRQRPSLKAFSAISMYLKGSSQSKPDYNVCMDILKITPVEVKATSKLFEVAIKYNQKVNSQRAICGPYL